MITELWPGWEVLQTMALTVWWWGVVIIIMLLPLSLVALCAWAWLFDMLKG
jgi:hypothetical protein